MSAYFDYSPMIRKLIYTTNTTESYHSNIRKGGDNIHQVRHATITLTILVI